MKGINTIKVLSVFLVLSYLLSACAGGAAPTPSAGNDKPLARPVIYMGVVESILDDQWVINGITVTIDPSIVRDGPYSPGDRVKVEAIVNEDGSLTVSGVEAVDPGDTSTLPELGDDNNDNSSDDNSNGDDSNIDNSNDDNANDSNFNDGNGNVSNTNDDSGNVSNSNDDNGNDTNTNEDNSNDDSGANSNDDDNSNGSNSNDDNDDDSNSNDDDDDDDDENSND